jgi:response regulator RpfG family c-di-GMP phosphodiesterase
MSAPEQPIILVVDDTPDNLVLMRDLLKDQYRIQVANHGAKALEIVERTPPDLILLDIMMPEMDGYEVCTRLKLNPDTRDIPVLFLTAMDRVEDEAKGFRTGCVDYITKPISPPLVLARVATHLEQHRLRLAERELMEKTLKGALALIIEMLSMTDPGAFGRARELADISEQVARGLAMEEPWMVSLAAVLSQIGTLTLPPSIAEKIGDRMPLTSEEREAFDRVPEIGYHLLKGIPRMEEIAEVIYYSHQNYNGSGFPKDGLREQDLPLGSRILRAVADFISRRAGGEKPVAIVRAMYNCISWYDQDVLQTLGVIAEELERAPVSFGIHDGARELAIHDLEIGYTIARPIETNQGTLLIRANTLLHMSQLERIRNFHKIKAIPDTVWVLE